MNKQNFRWVFEQMGKLELWQDASDADFERRDNDLYFFDPRNETGITFGRMGDGWCCLYESYFTEA